MGEVKPFGKGSTFKRYSHFGSFTNYGGAILHDGAGTATGSRHRALAPYQALKAKDGFIILGCANQRTWERFCQDVIGKPEWIEDDRFKTNTDRMNHVDELEQKAIFQIKCFGLGKHNNVY